MSTPTIQVLPQHIADQIAAGEVVERPASVVKELVENSFDAGATHVQVELKMGGKTLIRVTDNGHGMAEADLRLCVARHATSKIRTTQDLFQVGTYGFRGEALAAISAVARVSITSARAQDDIGTQLVTSPEGTTVTPAAANTGTIIEIRDLFYTTPARLAYLKTDRTELRAVTRVLQEFALAQPGAALSLHHEDKEILAYTAQSPQERAQTVLKHDHPLIEVSHQARDLTITGYTGHPLDAVRTRGRQFLMVNGRAVSDAKAVAVIRQAYIRACGLEKHLHPLWALHLTTDPLLVDVNVHPRKQEVKFAEPRDVYDALHHAITTSLEASAQTFTPTATPFVPPTAHAAPASNPVPLSFTSPPAYRAASQSTHKAFPSTSFAQQHQARTHTLQHAPSIPTTTPTSAEPAEVHPTPPLTLRAVGQVANKYILAEGDNGLYVFDQHALHERQRFERLLDAHNKQSIPTQALLVPEAVPLTPDEALLLQENTTFITSLGFTLTVDETTAHITEVPQFVAGMNLPQLVQDIAHYLHQDQTGSLHLERCIRHMLEVRSCRGSVFFGDPMELPEMQRLLDDFAHTQWKWLCPHGRPNHILWRFEDLDKAFHR